MQLYSGSNSDFVKFYDIGALPRFIFLDKEGQIISPDEIRPSNPETIKKIESTILQWGLGVVKITNYVNLLRLHFNVSNYA